MRQRPGAASAGLIAALSAALFAAACVFETAVPAPALSRQLRYGVAIGGADSAYCRVRVDIVKWPDGEPLLFQAPRYYSDNPALPLKGFTASDFRAEDSLARPLPVRDTALASGELDGDFIVMPPGTRSITYDVDHDPKDAKRFGLPLPGLGQGVQAIDGAYYFILPLVGSDIATQWRRPMDIRLDFSLAPGFNLVGQDASLALATNYELMFVRAVVNPLKTRTFTQGNHQVTTYTTTHDSVDLEAFDILLGKCLRLVEDSLLPYPETNVFVGEMPVFWGIEGTQGFWFRPEAAAMSQVHAHELVHTFVGVRHGELDDPWWKEGVTNYLGELLPVQAGLYPESLFAADVQWPRDTIDAVKDFALSDPYVRNHLFWPLDSAYVDKPDKRDFYSLVYGKGMEAAMIIDRYIIEGSARRHSIFDLIKALVRRYGPAFDRDQLVATVDDLSGRDSRAFLSGLLDKPGGFPADSLQRTYAALKALGHFHAEAAAKAAAGYAPGPARAVPRGSKL